MKITSGKETSMASVYPVKRHYRDSTLSSASHNKLNSPFIPQLPPVMNVNLTDIQQLSTPPTGNFSPNYEYGVPNDYFQCKSRPTISIDFESPTVATFISPIEFEEKDDVIGKAGNKGFSDTEPTITSLVRRASILQSNATSPMSDDKAYIPSDSCYKFLCVDDNIINLRIITRLLKKLFPYASIDITTDPIEALEMIEMNNYNMCFLDIEMPKLSGKELARRVRSTNFTLGLIAVTTRAGAEDLKVYEEIGIDTTFAKPLRDSYSHMLNSIENTIMKRSSSISKK